MKREIKGTVAPFVEVELAKGESVLAESGSLLYREASVSEEAEVPGGWSSGLLRKLAGTSFFLVRCTGPGMAAFSKDHAGQVIEIELDGDEVLVQNRAFLFAEPGVEVGVGVDGSASLLSRGAFSHLFSLRLTGRGRVCAVAWGDAQKIALGAGERIYAAPGKVTALSRSVVVERARIGGWREWLTDHGRRISLTGPGVVWLQSRDFESAHPRPQTTVVNKSVHRDGKGRRPRRPDDDPKEQYLWDGFRGE